MLADADCIIGHNIIHFDIPCISRIYPWFERPYLVDTLLLSRLYHPNLLDIDQKRKWPTTRTTQPGGLWPRLVVLKEFGKNAD